MSETLTADVLERLRERAKRGGFPAVVVLPSKVRDGKAYYSEFDLEAMKNAREAGVEAEFLDGTDERRYLSEYGADVVLAFAVSVMQDLTVEGLKAVGTYFLAQLRGATARLQLKGSGDAEVSIDVAKIRLRPGEVDIEGLHVKARGEKAIASLLPLLGRPGDAVAALRQLERPSGSSELGQPEESSD